MSGGGSSGGGSTQNTEPWSGQQEYLKEIFERGQLQARKGIPAQYNEIGPDERFKATDKYTGINGYDAENLNRMGLDAGATQTAVRSNGFVPFTGYEQEAQNRAVDLARSGVDPNLKAAQRQLTNNQGISQLKRANPAQSYLNQTARGDYLTPDSNPYLRASIEAAQDPVVSRFNEQVLPGISGQFGASGRFGSGAHQAAVNRASDDLTRNMANASTQAYANAYGQERGHQQGSQAALGQLNLQKNQALAEAVQRNAAISPSLANATRQQHMANLGLLEGVGGAQADKAYQLGNMAQDPYNFRSTEDRTRLRDYATLIQGTPVIPTSTTTNSGGGRNRTAGALGGAATGAYMGSSLGPYGTAAGAVIGGVGGYFL